MNDWVRKYSMNTAMPNVSGWRVSIGTLKTKANVTWSFRHFFISTPLRLLTLHHNHVVWSNILSMEHRKSMSTANTVMVVYIPLGLRLLESWQHPRHIAALANHVAHKYGTLLWTNYSLNSQTQEKNCVLMHLNRMFHGNYLEIHTFLDHHLKVLD